MCLFELAQVMGAGELGTLDSGPDTLVPQPQHADHGDSKEIRFKVFQLFFQWLLICISNLTYEDNSNRTYSRDFYS